MSLEKLASDLANFKYGMSSPDKLDNQTKYGVDFFPNDDASGFTPKTNLESLYHKVKEGTFAKEWPGAAPKNEKTRQAYGQQGEYKVGGMIGRAVPQFIFSGDTFSTPWSLDFPSQFQSDFMTAPIANHISGYSPPSILSQTFILSPPDLQKPDFSSWMTFSPIGDNVTQFASLLPLTERTSQFSFPEADRQNNISVNPEGFLGLQTTFDLPRESWRYSTTNDTFQPTFSSLGLGSSQFTDQIDLFHRYESSEFTNLPGMGTDNKFFNRSLGLGGSFRKVADPVGLTHPIILRPFGSNWKSAYEDLQVPNWIFKSPELKFGQSLGVEGVSFGNMGSRNIADEVRILRWSITPDGASFVRKQHSLQRMNPTIETKQFNADSILGVAGGLDKTVLPIYHPERHVGGLASRYENVLDLTGWNPEEGLQLTGGSRLAYQAAAFSPPIPARTIDINEDASPFARSFGRISNFAINTYNAVVDLVKAPIMIGLSNPNKYSPWPSAAPISTHLGIVAFGTPTAMVVPDTLIALHKPGGTFNKKTATKGLIGDLKYHGTSPYTDLHKSLSYNPGFGTGKQRTKDLGQQGMVVTGRMRQADSHQNQLDKSKGIKGDLKSDNIDKINVLRYPLDYKDSPDNPNLRDFIKFKFRDVVNKKYIIFRAILDGISDSITPEYGEERYIGRPDKVYVYQGADRSVSFNFSIYPKTKQELPILMEKLNYLVGLCYPSYTAQEMMVTPFIELTIGDMFVNTSGLLWGLTVTVEDTGTWELEEGLQFPHYIKAACEFKYIGNNKLSSTSPKHYNGLKVKKWRGGHRLDYKILEPPKEPYLPSEFEGVNDASLETVNA